jgi:hypothetical protein
LRATQQRRCRSDQRRRREQQQRARRGGDGERGDTLGGRLTAISGGDQHEDRAERHEAGVQSRERDAARTAGQLHELAECV